mmetsp:Transcript_33479/g.61899  ORF Transcript_33479/g.61899 Transcript_33479/m.61899 type:complete len:257 (+) Transcript_33479:2624-3394(+)
MKEKPRSARPSDLPLLFGDGSDSFFGEPSGLFTARMGCCCTCTRSCFSGTGATLAFSGDDSRDGGGLSGLSFCANLSVLLALGATSFSLVGTGSFAALLGFGSAAFSAFGGELSFTGALGGVVCFASAFSGVGFDAFAAEGFSAAFDEDLSGFISIAFFRFGSSDALDADGGEGARLSDALDADGGEGVRSIECLDPDGGEDLDADGGLSEPLDEVGALSEPLESVGSLSEPFDEPDLFVAVGGGAPECGSSLGGP